MADAKDSCIDWYAEEVNKAVRKVRAALLHIKRSRYVPTGVWKSLESHKDKLSAVLLSGSFPFQWKEPLIACTADVNAQLEFR